MGKKILCNKNLFLLADILLSLMSIYQNMSEYYLYWFIGKWPIRFRHRDSIVTNQLAWYTCFRFARSASVTAELFPNPPELKRLKSDFLIRTYCKLLCLETLGYHGNGLSRFGSWASHVRSTVIILYIKFHGPLAFSLNWGWGGGWGFTTKTLLLLILTLVI